MKNRVKTLPKALVLLAFLPSVNVNRGFYSQNVRIRSKSDDLAAADGGNQRFMPEFLPGMDIGKMDFDGRNATGHDRISQGNAGVCIGGSVEDDHFELPFGLLDPGDQLAFKVGLAEVNFYPQLPGSFADPGFDVCQSKAPIDLGFALTEQIQVGSIQEEEFHARDAV